MQNDQLNQYFETKCDEVNRIYFEALLQKFRNQKVQDISIFHPVERPDSKVYPHAILDNKKLMPIKQYSELSAEKQILSDLVLIKMHAGIGSSVDRLDHLKAHSSRSSLGAKGTDLFVKGKSLAELQIEQVRILNKSPNFKKVFLKNLVNEETREVVENLSQNCEVNLPVITQFKMPTIDQTGEISLERLAPGGHAFLGFYLLLDLLKNPVTEDQIVAIGNGEDLNSTPDLKILNWMEKEQVPICMITTNKTVRDKKGGQLAVVKEEIPFLTIVEKAQAERANQLEYFEALGLREEDDFSLFNTNIVLINTKIMSKLIQEEGLTESEFIEIITPDLIKNLKTQDGKEFIQLEGAIASVMLNIDKYFREKKEKQLIQFLNLNEVEREQFFIPIKKMEDFEMILAKYKYSEISGRFEL